MNTQEDPAKNALEPGVARTGQRRLAWLPRFGRNSWYALGIIALTFVVFWALGAMSSFVVPLVIAVILGAILSPVAEWLTRHGMAGAGAAAVTLLGGLLLAALVVYVIVVGFVEQLPEIVSGVVAGWGSLLAWVDSMDIDPVLLEQGMEHVQALATQALSGVFGMASSVFTGLFSFLLGTFFAVFFLFFILRDGHKIPGLISAKSGWDGRVVAGVYDVSTSSIRGYFRGTAITAVITEPIFLIPLLIFQVPLFIPMAVMYFVLSFIPYVGAWITAAFAVLIAFGSGGASVALIVGAALLVSNGMIQSAVSSWALGSSLKLHPVSVLLATLVGGAIAGILGMVLGAPVLASISKSAAVIKGNQPAADVHDGTEKAGSEA